MKKDSRRDLDLTNERNENSLKDLKNTFALYKASMSADHDRIENRMVTMVEKATSTWTQILVRILLSLVLHSSSLANGYDRRGADLNPWLAKMFSTK